MDEIMAAAALRKIAHSLTDLARALEGGGASEDSRKAAALLRFDVPPEQGLSRADASAALRENGLSPSMSGYWARSGLIDHDGDRRWLTPAGREWAASHTA